MRVYITSILNALFCAAVAYQSFDINISCLVFLIMFNILFDLGKIHESLNKD